jgi:hypothetical protein
MSEVVQDADHEFWRAPLAPAAVPTPTAAPLLTETCYRCNTEFLMGAAFCHSCGAARELQTRTHTRSWTRYFEFQHIKDRLGLPTFSLMAFLTGLGCLLCAVFVGLIFSAATVLDWQAVQLWRIEWLLGAAACFLAGILLRCMPTK